MDKIELFWDRVNSLIKTKNLTQSSLSTQCGFNPRRLQNLSGGNRLPDCFEAVEIAKVLGTTVEYLVTGELSESQNEINDLKKKVLDFANSL